MPDFNPKLYKLLIVDDVSKNIQVLGSILRNHGYQISFAMDGKRALDLTSKEKYDLILLDVMMPELDGYDVCAILKQDPFTRDIPVIFLTAKTEVDSIVKGFKLGAVDYITKPFYSEELLSRVKTHLELKTTREKLAQSNAAKDMFFSIIAHDLKNPFHAMLGFSELLLSSFDTLDKGKKIKYIQNIYDSGTSLYKLLENLLQWSRLQTGSIECNRKNINPLSILEQCLKTLYSNSALKKINIIKNIDPGIQAFADPDMTRLIFRNLI
ncbi:MAG: hybrid sensor histidine kinase/response regulator, partial [Thermodesulfobacteriota bacterium]|nr:hybrid sensor histidine kinase/response regulator [Thermodesulfobacteriota bacterium]